MQVNVHHIIDALKFTSAFAGKTDVRYYLNGVYFERTADSNLQLIGTDGHRLGHVTLEVPVPIDFQPFIMPIETVSQVIKTIKPKMRDDYSINVDASLIGNIQYQAIDGKYPDWLAVVNRVRSADRVPQVEGMGINMQYLVDALNASKFVGKHCVFTFAGPKEALMLDIPSLTHLDAYAIVMPCKLINA